MVQTTLCTNHKALQPQKLSSRKRAVIDPPSPPKKPSENPMEITL
jgi:hypothetical protein